jgi:hypothetical protein
MTIEGKAIAVSGRFPRIARLRAEYYEYVAEPRSFIDQLKASGGRADVFTFLQETPEKEPKHRFRHEWESISVVRISTFDHWWKKQVNDKTRNMVRKAQKAGVELRAVPYSDEFVRGIVKIYNESPVRQGKPFKHYGKNFETIKAEHGEYLDRAELIGAYYQDELIGFIKLVHGRGVSNLMNIISMISHRDKAPTNALIARAVEICAQRGVPYLHYGLWSKRGLGDFKKHHAFEQMDVVRYFVPLKIRGQIALGLKLHRSLTEMLPEKLVNVLAEWRAKWNARRRPVPQAATGQ